MTKLDRLHFTGNDEADALLVDEPLALLVGFVLDQQVSVPVAFNGPLKLKQRLGKLDAREIASMDPAKLDAVFRKKPAVHRFPSNMAKRTQDMCAVLVEDYGGDAARVWADAETGQELAERIGALPGFGEMKVNSLVAVLAKRLEVCPPGIDDVMPKHPTMGDIDSAEALKQYQAKKRAMKAEKRAKATS